MRVTIDISDEWIDALIGGARINYWGRWHHNPDEDRRYILDWCADPLIDYHPDDWHEITRERVQASVGAFIVKCPQQFADAITGRWDATTGDMFLQIVCFGKVLYG